MLAQTHAPDTHSRIAASQELRLPSLFKESVAFAPELASANSRPIRQFVADCRSFRFLRAALWELMTLLVASSFVTAATAHPHVWVTFHSDVLYSPDGAMTGIRHIWSFDDMYSAFALQGIKHAKKGEYTREELSSLAHLNVTSLKDFDFFTFVQAFGRKMEFADPTDYWLDYKDTILTLHFTLPVKEPLPADVTQIEIYDPSIFVDFEFAKTHPVNLVGAPPQCRLDVELPHEPTAADQVRLSQLDAHPLASGDTYGEMFANKIFVKCP
jgi:ABC-type uncharacterized transport system substrate-binding protein